MGAVEGCLLGLLLGLVEGCILGETLGEVDGCLLGEVEGEAEGCLLGLLLGLVEGCLLGDALGEVEGCLLGVAEGDVEGEVEETGGVVPSRRFTRSSKEASSIAPSSAPISDLTTTPPVIFTEAPAVWSSNTLMGTRVETTNPLCSSTNWLDVNVGNAITLLLTRVKSESP